MASVDQGASQRRAGNTAGQSPVGQGSSLSPLGSSGQSYAGPTLGQASQGSGSSWRRSVGSQPGPGSANPETPDRGTSYFSPSLSAPGAHDTAVAVRSLSVQASSPLGTADPETPDRGKYYSSALSVLGAHDVPSARRGTEEALVTRIPTSGQETPDRSTGFFGTRVGDPMRYRTTVTYYKLRAQDTSQLPTVAYVYWTSTSPTLSSFTGGGTLAGLTVLASWQVAVT